MKTLEEIKQILQTHKQELMDKYKVRETGIFGSYVRGKQKDTSDIDILIDFSQSVGLIHFIRLKNYLSESLNSKVDLVQKGAMRPEIEKEVLKDIIII